ncbi:MAG: hypothetical protein WAU96_12450 [Anaerolineae bacterium]
MKNSGGGAALMLLMVLVAVFICGVLAAGDFGHIGTVQPSQEVVDQTTIATTTAQIARDNKINKIVTDFLDALTKLIFFSVLVLMATAVGVSVVFIVAKWIKRHDRKPDEAGRYPLVPSDAKLTNPNLTGALTAAPAGESAMLALAAMQRDVNMTWGAFANGIQGRQASDRQRDLRPDPPGWDGTIEMPPPTPQERVSADGFLMLDESGAQKPLALTFNQENRAW